MENIVCSICGSSTTRGGYWFNKDGAKICRKCYDRLYRRKLTNVPENMRCKTFPNEIVVLESHAEIVLYDYKGNPKCKALIDKEDIDKVKSFKWYEHNLGYVGTCIGRETLLLHRLIMNPSKDQVVDHISHDKLDNRKCNLRVCTQAENRRNNSIYSNNTSGYTGVFFNTQKNKWQSVIKINGKTIHLGFYILKEDAIEARVQAEKLYFGNFRKEVQDD